MLVRSITQVISDIPKGIIVEVMDETKTLYLIKYVTLDGMKNTCGWFPKNEFERVNDICVVSGQPGTNVEHPKHYNKGIEVWDYTDSWKMDFLEGNIIKYITRYKYKNGIEDLKKAKQYIERLIEREEKENEGIEE